MAEGTLQILGLGTSAVPLDYNVSGNQPLDLIAVKADFDGTSAGSDFVPVIEILSSADKLMAQSIGSTVAAGDSVTVTFAPFLRGAGSGGTGGGIQFDTDPQAGGFLKVTTTNAGAGSFALESGGQLDVTSADTMTLASDGDAELHTDGNMLIDSFDGITIDNSAAGLLLIRSHPDQGMEIHDAGAATSSGVVIHSDQAGVAMAGEYLTFEVRGDNFYVVLGTGRRVQVLNHLGAAIFEVREDGSLHGLTGQSLTFDL